MRRWLEPALRRIWDEDPGVWSAIGSALLFPLELAYRGAVAARNRAYDHGWLSSVESSLPVVSVGNVLVGGAGKTPVSAWVARILSGASRAPAVVLRGYGDDERRLHERWNPEIPVFAASDRVRAVTDARAEGCRSIVLDDGFQHRRLSRRLDLVLVPVEGPWRVRLLPRGPFREPLAAIGRADHVVLTRRIGDAGDAREAEQRIRRRFPETAVAHLRLTPAGWSTPTGEEADAPGNPLLAVTGIARPAEFKELATRLTGAPVELLSFPDHHDFTGSDLERIRRRARGRVVVTTEKDAVRLPGGGHEFGAGTRILRLRVEEGEGSDRLRRAILRATGNHSSEGAPAGGSIGDQSEAHTDREGS